MRRRSFLAALSIAALAACGGGASDAAHPAPGEPARTLGTYDRIQRDLFDAQCTSCHVAGSSVARQSGLVLDAASAYAQLVGVVPTNASARADGLRRVVAGQPDSSLLYHKLVWLPGHHAHDYGLPMPAGATQGISQGMLEYVRRWIQAGAPRTGVVADTTVLADRRTQVASFAPLPPPPAGQGIQLKVDSFGVRPSFERELFVWRTLNNASDLYVTRLQTRMRPGSHHLLLYTFDRSRSSLYCAVTPTPNAVRDIRNADGTMNLFNMIPMACHVFFGGSMATESDYTFPPGTALRLPASAGLDFNVHYVNKTSGEIPGEAYANLWTVDRSQVQRVVSTLNMNNESITLPPQQRTTLTKSFAVGAPMTVLALTSHMHKLGEKFEIRVRRADGSETTVYTNTDWEHPQLTTFATPLALQAGDALVSVVTWNNTTDRTIRFGLTSEDEMDIIFGYYY